MNLQTELYVSLDGLIYNRLDLSKSESINKKYTLKDTTDLSTIFSPYSQAFTFPATLNNQKALGFIGIVSVLKSNKNTLDCKLYINGKLNQSGKLKITNITEEYGRITSYTGNLTTSMQSLKTRLGDDTISDLPTNNVSINWLPNEVYNSLKSIKQHPTMPINGVNVKYFVPLMSNKRVFQIYNVNQLAYIDNVSFYNNVDPLGEGVLKPDELNPSIQGRVIIDLIKAKYGLKINIPIEKEAYYNDWYILCNADKSENNEPVYFDVINNFGTIQRYDVKNGFHIPTLVKYSISVNTETNLFTLNRVPNFDGNFDKDFKIVVVFNKVLSVKSTEDVNINVSIEKDNGVIVSQESAGTDADNNITVTIVVKDTDFVGDTLNFKLKVNSAIPIVWKSSDVRLEFGYRDGKFGLFNSTAYASYRQSSLNNNNSDATGLSKIDLFKTLPNIKCVDFLASFFKVFNISVFDTAPDSDELFWLTPRDVATKGNQYSKKEVDYTPYVSSRIVPKEIANDYNYYNFKHKTSKYKSNADYLLAKGIEFGQVTYPTIKPEENLSEFKVETDFCILESLPIAGAETVKTSYAFTSDSPTILDTGERRYKPNTEDLTIFFANGIQVISQKDRIAVQTYNTSGNVTASGLDSYVKTSPIHKSGFSFGFGLIQEAVKQSLYYNFYREQTEKFLNPNTLLYNYELILPASELSLNFSTTSQGLANVPDGFRLQNEIVIQEQRFSVVDATIDVTTGNSKMKLLNIVNSFEYLDDVIEVEPEPEQPIVYNFYYRGFFNGNEPNAREGSVTYYDLNGVIQVADGLLKNECRLIPARSIITTEFAVVCNP